MPAPYYTEDIVTKLITRVSPESSPGTVEEQFRDGVRNAVKKIIRQGMFFVSKNGMDAGETLQLLVKVESYFRSDSVTDNRIDTWKATLKAEDNV